MKGGTELGFTPWTQVGGRRAGAQAFAMPANWDYVRYGDSRSALEMDGTRSGAYGTGVGVNDATGVGGVAGWIGPLSDHRMRTAALHSYGIGGQGIGPEPSANMLAIPRPGTPALGLDYVAANPAGIVIFHAGYNNGINGGSPATFAAVTSALRALTDPSYVYPPLGTPLPLANGLPKNVIIIAEAPCGINKSGATQNAQDAPYRAAMQALVAFYMRWDHASGDPLANPRIKVFDTYNHPLLMDGGSGTNHYNIAGIQVDGLHPTVVGSRRQAQIIADWVNGLNGPTPRNHMPTAATASSYCNPNPLLTGTSGTFTGAGTHSGAVASNTSANIAANLNVDFSSAADPGGNGNVQTMRITGTIAVDSGVRLRQLLPMPNGNFTVGGAGDIYRGVGMVGMTITAGVVKCRYIQLTLTPTDATYTTQVTAQNLAAAYGGQTRFMNDPLGCDHGPIPIQTPLADLSGHSGKVFNNNISNLDLNVQLAAGTVDVTLTLSQFGVCRTGG